jgi:aminoglycoside phosphotransferase (APT) family kinase protein
MGGADQRIAAWLGSLLGGQVVGWWRQPRWRPMWFADVATGHGVQAVVVRGERADVPLVFPLHHEMRFQRLLHEHGIPVPEVYGWCDDPPAYAMAAVPGRADFSATTDAAQAAVVDQYLQVLAQLHALPVEPFRTAGIVTGRSPADAAHVGIRQYLDMYAATKVRPDPLLEFVLGWLRRHPPPLAQRMSPVVWDSGQFHHADGQLLAIMDCELGHVGDPLMDLAAGRMRDTVIPYGDFDRLYERYTELSGTPVDRAAIQFHHLFFTLTNQLAFHAPLAEPRAGTDYMTYAQWVSETNLHAVETLAEYLSVELEPVEVPGPLASPVAAAHEHLSATLRSVAIDDP